MRSSRVIVVTGGIAAVALTAAIASYYGYGSGPSEGSEVTATVGEGPMLATGLKLNHSGIRVNSELVAFAIRLRGKIPLSVIAMLIITSGIRSDESQAKVMIDYLARYGKDKFVGLYKAAATELMALPRVDVATWSPKVTELYGRGLLKRKGHTTAKALDFAYANAVESATIIAAVNSFGPGYNAYNDGPCVHMDIP